MIHYSSDVINYEVRFKQYLHKLMMTHFINIPVLFWHRVNEVINYKFWFQAMDSELHHIF